MGDSNFHEVSLPEFAAWALAIGWVNMPSKLVEIARAPKGKRGKRPENPKQRVERIARRVSQEKAKGTTNFLQVVAVEEKISVSRVKQILGKRNGAKAGR